MVTSEHLKPRLFQDTSKRNKYSTSAITASRITSTVDRAAADAAHAERTAFTQSRHLDAVNKQLDKVLSLNGFLNEMPKIQVLATDFLEVRTAFYPLSDFCQWII